MSQAVEDLTDQQLFERLTPTIFIANGRTRRDRLVAERIRRENAAITAELRRRGYQRGQRSQT